MIFVFKNRKKNKKNLDDYETGPYVLINIIFKFNLIDQLLLDTKLKI